VIRIFIK